MLTRFQEYTLLEVVRKRKAFRMGIISVLCILAFVVDMSSSSEDYYDSEKKEASATFYEKKSNPVKCYHCAYTPSREEVEEIKVPKIIKETFSVPKVVETETRVPRVIWEEVKRPRVIFEEFHFYDEPTWQWKIGTRSKKVNEIVWLSRKIYENKKVTKQVTDKEVRTKKVYNIRKITKVMEGGWSKCQGPFTPEQAQTYGVDEWECDSNCYIRLDRQGNALRGCYKDEFGVDPYKIGCHEQAGYTYCFCEGSQCNNGAIPKPNTDEFK